MIKMISKVIILVITSITGIVLVTGLSKAETKFPRKVKLEYKFLPGWKTTYKVDSFSHIEYSPSVKIKAEKITLDKMKREAGKIVTQEVIATDEKRVALEIKEKYSFIKVNEELQPCRSGRFSEPNILIISKDASVLTAVGNPFTGALQPLSPGREVKIGDTWTKEVVSSWVEDVEGTSKHSYTLLGFEKVKGYDCAKIDYIVTRSSKKPFTSTAKVKGTIYFAYQEGIIVSLETEGSATGKATIEGKKHLIKSSSKEKIEIVKREYKTPEHLMPPK